MRHHDVACLKMRQVACGNSASYLVEAEMVETLEDGALHMSIGLQQRSTVRITMVEAELLKIKVPTHNYESLQ